MACISSFSTKQRPKSPNLTKKSLDLPHIVKLYREEAVARVHLLPIPPHRLPWLSRTIKEGKDVFITNMTIILNYYGAACKILQMMGHMTEAGELESRRLHLKTIFGGLNLTMISILQILESKLDGLDENGDTFDFCTFGFSALEAELSKHLNEVDVVEHGTDAVSIGSQYSAVETSPAEFSVAESIVEAGSTTVNKSDNMLAEAFESPLAPETTEQHFEANDKAAVEQHIQDDAHEIVEQLAKCSDTLTVSENNALRTNNETANSPPAATSDPMQSEYELTGEEEEDTIVITEEAEGEGEEALPAQFDTPTLDEQTSQQCHEAVLSGEQVFITEEADEKALSRDQDSAASPIQDPSSDDINEEGLAGSYFSRLSQEVLNLHLLEDFKIAEGFLSNTSDEEDHDSCTVHTGPMDVHTAVGPGTDDESLSGSDEAEFEENPTSAETTLLEDGEGMGEILFRKDHAVAEEKKESVEAVNAINHDELDSMPGSFPMKHIDHDKGPEWSIRAILGTVAAVGISMSVIYPTFSAFVLFGIIRFARSRR